MSVLQLPNREDSWKRLRSSSAENPFDVLVVGGGATGCGVALDAASRGLRTALVERVDFGAGTSSRSTKLVHGGVRYLEKAVFGLDAGQLALVFEALHERATMLRLAPHLTRTLPIMTPCYSWLDVPYYWAGLKAYDTVANVSNLAMSRFVSAAESVRRFPTLATKRADGRALKATIEYFDGQFDDARYALALALTASGHGAAVVNHADVVGVSLPADGAAPPSRAPLAAASDSAPLAAASSDADDNSVAEATPSAAEGSKTLDAAAPELRAPSVVRVRDAETGRVAEVHARVVVNAAGPFTDAVRELVLGTGCRQVIMPSAGVHIALPSYFAPDGVGMIVPKTQDGRVVFVLPWGGGTIAGTTDTPCAVTMAPRGTAEDVAFIIDAISDYLAVPVRREDVQSVWSGIRPLAIDPSATRTSDLVREHVVAIEAPGFVTVTGGKWTTYRRMAEDAVDAAVAEGRLAPAAPCTTARLPLVGAERFTDALFAHVAQGYDPSEWAGPVAGSVARHLASAHGGDAAAVVELARREGLSRRLSPRHDIIEAQVAFSARHELCRSAEDFLGRRCRLAFIDVAAARAAVPRVVDILGDELGWRRWTGRRARERAAAEAYLATFEAASGQ